MEGRVGIVLVNYNGLRFMPDCLESLARIDYTQARTVIVDNNSSDGSLAWLAGHYPHLPLVALSENRGITGGNNAGIRWCQENSCDFVLLLNNDTVVEPDFLSRLMEQAGPDCLTVPKIYFWDNKQLINNHVGDFDFWRGVHRDWFYGKTDSDASRTVRFARMANTCALLIPMPVIERVGLMDDAFFMYADDTDFITRAVRQGVLIKFVPEAVLYHRESSSSGGPNSPLSVYYNNRNRLYLMFKHQKNRLALGFFLLYFALTRLTTVVSYVGRGQWKQLTALRRAIIDFCRGRMGYAPPVRFS